MTALLAMLVACPFTAPFRVCKTPQIATAPAPHVHRSASRSNAARVEADAVPLASPASVAEDPLKEDVLLSDGHWVTVTVAQVFAAPPLAAGRDVLRPVVGALRL